MKKQTKQFSVTYKQFIRKLKRDNFEVIFFRMFVLVAFVGAWELLTSCGAIDPFFVSSPSRIVKQLQQYLATSLQYYYGGMKKLEKFLNHTLSF